MARYGESNTKYKFIKEALFLFAERGYKAVSVAEIAEAVGCSAPALYKHYKNKQELFEAIIKNSNAAFEKRMKENENMIMGNSDNSEEYLNVSEEQEIKIVQDYVREAVHDEMVQAFRKMCAVEQFNMPKLAAIYTYRYIAFPVERYELFFKHMMSEGLMKEANARVLARIYNAVPTIAIGICDREPEREEECMQMIADHIREFNRVYRIR